MLQYSNSYKQNCSRLISLVTAHLTVDCCIIIRNAEAELVETGHVTGTNKRMLPYYTFTVILHCHIAL